MDKYQIINSIYNNKQKLYSVLFEYLLISIPAVSIFISLFIVNDDTVSVVLLYISQILEIIMLILFTLFYKNSILNVYSIYDIKNVFDNDVSIVTTLIDDRKKMIDSFYRNNIARIYIYRIMGIYLILFMARYNKFIIPIILFMITIISTLILNNVITDTYVNKFPKVCDILNTRIDDADAEILINS